ncbi:hypothetical protein B4O85_02375 [Pseudomonas azotoformans]|uniref:DUF1534 domain-containing protein n=1 Tax=Pseudomonas azotoformans TaxID=47878 RepID=A0A4V1K1P3_PSEAZ|nr:hypothetical protein B4O85_02375 [Pseudomonas azotoformans]
MKCGSWLACDSGGCDRSHALRGNTSSDALRRVQAGRGASRAAFPRGAWERSSRAVEHQYLQVNAE